MGFTIIPKEEPNLKLLSFFFYHLIGSESIKIHILKFAVLNSILL
jgi:hypothetical protein